MDSFVHNLAQNVYIPKRKQITCLCQCHCVDCFPALDKEATSFNEAASLLSDCVDPTDSVRLERCAAQYQLSLRFVHGNGIAGENMTVQTDAGLVYGRRIDENQYRVQLNNPGILDLHRKEDAAYVELGCPGVPHGVLEIPGLEWTQREQLREMAKALRYDPAFPKGANINLYTWLGDAHIRILTYERGVEDYTLACGTGTASTACTLFARGQLPGKRLVAENPGGTLTVDLEGQPDAITAVFLEGPTQIVDILER